MYTTKTWATRIQILENSAQHSALNKQIAPLSKQ